MPRIMNQLEAFNQNVLNTIPRLGPIPDFRAGDTVRVDVKIKEGNKERFQAFEGVVIGRKNRGLHSSFRVRKIMADEGVERVFQLYSPLIKIELIRQGVVRRAKLYYLRQRSGKSARIKERYVPAEKRLAQKEALARQAKELEARAAKKAEKTEAPTETAEQTKA